MASGQADLSRARVSAEGWGPVRFGMTAEQASDATGHRFRLSRSKYCHSLIPPFEMDGMWLLMVYRGDRLNYLSVSKRTYLTDRGIGVGDSEQALRLAYPEAQPGAGPAAAWLGTYYYYDAPLGADGVPKALSFLVHDGEVVQFSAGVQSIVRTFYECA